LVRLPGPVNISINMTVPAPQQVYRSAKENNVISENVDFYLIIPPKEVPSSKQIFLTLSNLEFGTT
jgi:hypothetical protein